MKACASKENIQSAGMYQQISLLFPLVILWYFDVCPLLLECKLRWHPGFESFMTKLKQTPKSVKTKQSTVPGWRSYEITPHTLQKLHCNTIWVRRSMFSRVLQSYPWVQCPILAIKAWLPGDINSLIVLKFESQVSFRICLEINDKCECFCDPASGSHRSLGRPTSAPPTVC